jgi:hypothetical protein
MSFINALVIIAIGLVLAFAGKRFIWLLIGAAGFVVAYRIISWLIPGQSIGEFIVAAGAGLVLGWLATKFGKILLMIAAFILVGNLGLVVAGWFGITDLSLVGILFFFIGGLVGLAMLRWAGGLGLALISAIGGGAMVSYGLPMLFQSGGTLSTTLSAVSGLVFLVVAVVGFLFQQGMIGGKGKTATPAPQ